MTLTAFPEAPSMNLPTMKTWIVGANINIPIEAILSTMFTSRVRLRPILKEKCAKEASSFEVKAS